MLGKIEKFDHFDGVNIEHLRTFLDVSDTGSFHRSAERLNVTQSTVSARIKALEERLDRRLFVRHRNGVELTAAGGRLRRHAETAVKAWQQGLQSVALPDTLGSVYGFGVQPGLWERLGPPWVDWMRTNVPDLGLNVTVDYSDSLMRQLDDGLVDLAVMFAPRTRPGLRIEELLNDELVLVATQARDVASGWLDDYIFVDWSYDFRSAHSEAYPEMPTPALTVALPGIALRRMIDYGGSAYLARPMVESLLATGRLFLIEGAPTFQRPAYAVYPAEPMAPNSLAVALDGLRRVAAGGAG